MYLSCVDLFFCFPTTKTIMSLCKLVLLTTQSKFCICINVFVWYKLHCKWFSSSTIVQSTGASEAFRLVYIGICDCISWFCDCWTILTDILFWYYIMSSSSNGNATIKFWLLCHRVRMTMQQLDCYFDLLFWFVLFVKQRLLFHAIMFEWQCNT